MNEQEYTSEQVRDTVGLLSNTALDTLAFNLEHRIRGYLGDYAALLDANAEPVDDAAVEEALEYHRWNGVPNLDYQIEDKRHFDIIEAAYRDKCTEVERLTARVAELEAQRNELLRTLKAERRGEK